MFFVLGVVIMDVGRYLAFCVLGRLGIGMPTMGLLEPRESR